MNQKQINRSESYFATQAYLDANTSTWSSIPIIATVKSELDDLILALIQHKDAKQAAQVRVGKSKLGLKKEIADKLDILNDTLEAYANIEENAALENKASLSYSELYTMRNEDFITTVKEQIALLESHLTDLADYGMTEGQLTDLKTSYDSFLEISGMPRQYVIQSASATAELEALFPKFTELLEKKLDKLMKRFKRSNSSFYNGYLKSRVVVG